MGIPDRLLSTGLVIALANDDDVVDDGQVASDV